MCTHFFFTKFFVLCSRTKSIVIGEAKQLPSTVHYSFLLAANQYDILALVQIFEQRRSDFAVSENFMLKARRSRRQTQLGLESANARVQIGPFEFGATIRRQRS